MLAMTTPYLALRDQIEGQLTEGRQHRQQAGEAEKVETEIVRTKGTYLNRQLLEQNLDVRYLG